jgi:hypothetical protein
MFTGLVSGPDGLEVRAFECSLCNCSEKVTVETKWADFGQLAATFMSALTRPADGAERHYSDFAQSKLVF